jgi:hypothetical protein
MIYVCVWDIAVLHKLQYKNNVFKKRNIYVGQCHFKKNETAVNNSYYFPQMA